MNLAGKSVVLTGAASGIGRALYALLLDAGARVVAVDVNAAGLAGLEAREGASTCVADLATEAGVREALEAAASTLGEIDVFIANAGFAYYEVLGEPDWERTERIFRLNVFGPMYVAQAMKTRYAGKRPYRVVVTCSAMARMGLPGYSVYGATKAAIDRFAEAYRYELPANAKLQLVYPIATRTDFFEAEGKAPVPWPSQSPEHVAKRIMAGIRRGQDEIQPSLTFRLMWAAMRNLSLLRRWYQRRELKSLKAHHRI